MADAASNRSLAYAQIQAKRISPSPSICTGGISITTTLARNLNWHRRVLPNDPLPFELAGYIDRRQAGGLNRPRISSALSSSTRENTGFLKQLADSYVCLRRYADAERVFGPRNRVAPKDSNMRAYRAATELYWHANTRPLRSTINAIIAEDSREAENIAQLWLEVSLCERDFDGARRALAALPIAGCYDDFIPFPRIWCEGVVAQMRTIKRHPTLPFTTARTKRPS